VFAELPDDLRFIARKNVEAHDAPVGLRAAPGAHLSYHSWQGYDATEADDHLLPVGYAEPNPVPAEEHLGREAVPVAH
jgi:hypothetical protein